MRGDERVSLTKPFTAAIGTDVINGTSRLPSERTSQALLSFASTVFVLSPKRTNLSFTYWEVSFYGRLSCLINENWGEYKNKECVTKGKHRHFWVKPSSPREINEDCSGEPYVLNVQYIPFREGTPKREIPSNP